MMLCISNGTLLHVMGHLTPVPVAQSTIVVLQAEGSCGHECSQSQDTAQFEELYSGVHSAWHKRGTRNAPHHQPVDRFTRIRDHE